MRICALILTGWSEIHVMNVMMHVMTHIMRKKEVRKFNCHKG